MNSGDMETLPTPEIDQEVRARLGWPTNDSLDSWIRDKNTDRSINLYYQWVKTRFPRPTLGVDPRANRFFHGAHPFAPPKTYMKSQVEQRNTAATTLYATMSHVGDMYMHQQLEGSPRLNIILQQFLAASLRHRPPPPHFDSQIVYHISALLLASIAAFGRGDAREAGDYMEKAVSRTTETGMNRLEQTMTLKVNDPVVAELWVRTYWQLHIVIEALRDASSSVETKREFG